MLILFGRARGPIMLKIPVRRCEFGRQQIPLYVDRILAPELVDAFEMHLMDCTECRDCVQFGRMMKYTPDNSHKTSDGKPCASPHRRKR